MLHRERFPTLAEVISELTNAESRKKVSPKDGEAPTTVSVAHLAKKGEPRSNSGQAPLQGPRSATKEGTTSELVVCTYCKNNGHIKKDCRKLAWKEDMIRKGLWVPRDQKKAYVAKEEGEPSISRQEPAGKDGSEIQKFIQAEMNKLLQKISSTSLAQSGKHLALTTYSNITPMSASWILDSGATKHMSPNQSLFTTYELVTDGHQVRTANGGILEVAGKGTINLKGIVFSNVLHVPGLKANLLSLLQLVIDTGWRFILDVDSCFLCKKDTGRKISSVKRKGGLLLLEELEEEEEPRVAYTTQSEGRVTLLHRRLGHPSFHLLKQTHPTLFKGVFFEKLTCESCHFAKQRRSSFPSTNHRFMSAFECVHSDVWGPCSTSGLFQHKWFILFVDDFSRYTWVYLLKSKSEVPSVAKQFCEMIYNQFGKKVRTFRTDNAKEFFCRDLNKYMEGKGIVH